MTAASILPSGRRAAIWLIGAALAAALAPAAAAQTFAPPPPDPACAPHDAAWRAAETSGDPGKIEAAAQGYPSRCPNWAQVQATVDQLRAGNPPAPVEPAMPTPPAMDAPEESAPPPAPGDPMGQIPASHRSDVPPQ